MAGLPTLPSLPSISNSPGYAVAPSQTPAQQMLGSTVGGMLDSLNNAITPAPLQSTQTDTWTAIGSFFSLLSDVQRMATIVAGIVFLLAGLRLLGGKVL